MILYFLPAIIILGLITSYEDIKYGKIRNKWIIPALIYAFIANLGLIMYYYLGSGVRGHYIIELITNLTFSIAVGFGLWYMGLWTAGDGKLFIAFSALIPLSVYKIGYIGWTPSITLLSNILIPATLFIIIMMFFKIKIKNIKEISKNLIKEFFQPKILLTSFISFFAIIWLVNLFFEFIKFGDSFILRLILTILIFSKVNGILKDKSIYFMIILSLLRVVFDKSVYSPNALFDIILIIFIWQIVRSILTGVLSKLGRITFSKKIKVEKLKKCMMLSDVINKQKKISDKERKDLQKIGDVEIVKHKGFYYIKTPKSLFGSNKGLEEEAEGITKENIKRLKEIGFKEVRISQSMPFAGFIFFGVILTILAKGNILIVIKNIFLS